MKKSHSIMVVVVLVILLAGAWYWYNLRDRENANLSQGTEQHPSPEASIPSQDLVWYQIPELGLEFQVEALVVKKLKYVFNNEQEAHFTSARFSATDLISIPNCGTDAGPLGALVKIKGHPSDYADRSFYEARKPKQFENFFVFFDYPQSVCAYPEYQEALQSFFERNNLWLKEWVNIALDSVKEIQ